MKSCLPTLLCGALAFTLSACATDSSLSLGVEDTCGSLKSIVADYDSGFEAYRGAGSNYRAIAVYRAKTELVRGHCEIWAWAQGDHAYVCSANAPSAEVAQVRYDKSLSFLQQCLSDGWEQTAVGKSKNGEPTGVATRFTSNANPGLVVSVQKLIAPNAYRTIHSNYLFIGTAERGNTAN
ncbi:hypothetical protein [Marinobacter sp. CHS3-4]|uniref:hypothetical protein n=1 Tax=Marinobacter sp. CHS3-4 TaxID=3045174 RepID=UPI0024B54D65|nr:hypothetical protein [Marinobacter sp. CHS3-4]MDI9244257.1 hypothetical protein [Marinobacter sp. CHS3-4]